MILHSIEILPLEFESLTNELNKILGKVAIYIVGNCIAIFDGRIKFMV